MVPWSGPTALAVTGFFSNIDADSTVEMHYSNGFNSRTTISDDSAFATRITFRLNVGLGPAQLYAPPAAAEPLK